MWVTTKPVGVSKWVESGDRPLVRPSSAIGLEAELFQSSNFEARTSAFGQFQNWQATCSLVLFEGFAKIIYKNFKSWGFHFLT